mmetsp:Transcript_1399/g.2542  ORF Transcript_1399/g.2542 Transcript_1399/m.2542 type:complete len:527 (-) Transcript_1399:43-1623(-)
MTHHSGTGLVSVPEGITNSDSIWENRRGASSIGHFSVSEMVSMRQNRRVIESGGCEVQTRGLVDYSKDTKNDFVTSANHVGQETDSVGTQRNVKSAPVLRVKRKRFENPVDTFQLQKFAPSRLCYPSFSGLSLDDGKEQGFERFGHEQCGDQNGVQTVASDTALGYRELPSVRILDAEQFNEYEQLVYEVAHETLRDDLVNSCYALIRPTTGTGELITGEYRLIGSRPLSGENLVEDTAKRQKALHATDSTSTSLGQLGEIVPVEESSRNEAQSRNSGDYLAPVHKHQAGDEVSTTTLLSSEPVNEGSRFAHESNDAHFQFVDVVPVRNRPYDSQRVPPVCSMFSSKPMENEREVEEHVAKTNSERNSVVNEKQSSRLFSPEPSLTGVSLSYAPRNDGKGIGRVSVDTSNSDSLETDYPVSSSYGVDVESADQGDECFSPTGSVVEPFRGEKVVEDEHEYVYDFYKPVHTMQSSGLSAFVEGGGSLYSEVPHVTAEALRAYREQIGHADVVQESDEDGYEVDDEAE